MTRDAVQAQILGIIAEVTLAEALAANAGSLLAEDLGVESIDLLDIVFKVEERLSISLAPLPPFLDRAFFEPGAGCVEGGALTPAGRAALRGCEGLDEEALKGAGASAYLRSVGAVVDLAVARRQGRPDGLP